MSQVRETDCMEMLLQAWDAIEWNPLRWSLEVRQKLSVCLLRLYVGAALLWVGYQQWHDPAFASYLPSLLMNWAQRNPFFFYEDFLRYIATPNAHILAWLIPLSQITIGGLLALGLWTRWASGALFLLTMNYFFATQHTSPMAAGLNIGFMAMALVLLFAKAGYAYGLDQIVNAIGLHFGWVKPVRKKRKRRLPPPKPINPKQSKLKNLRLLSRPLPKQSRDDRREEREEEQESRKQDNRKVEKLRPGASRPASIENALGNTIRKLKERQHLKPVAKPLKRYDPDELEDDDDDEDEDDIYAYSGYDDDDDED
ncbi:MAG: DoxX family protein [Vampirovibrionales bacterium]|nr:DoxX family protein [Vampirovibrionales bacterium]